MLVMVTVVLMTRMGVTVLLVLLVFAWECANGGLVDMMR